MSRFLSLVLLLAVACPAFAQVPADLADDYIDETGIADRVEQVGQQMMQQIQSQAAQFPAPAQEPFREIYANAFSDEALDARVQTYVAAEGDADQLRAVMAWREEPLVERMQDLEEAAAEDQNGQMAVQMYAMAGNLGQHEVTAAREAQMDRYLDVTEADDAAVDLYLDLISASAMSMQSLQGDDADQPSPDSIRARMRPQLEGQVGGMVRGSSLYAYRDVSDEDLDAYITALEDPAAEYGFDFNSAAMRAALVSAITDAGETFVARLNDLDAAGEIDLDAMRAEAEAKAEAARQQQEMQQQQQQMMQQEMEAKDN